MGPPVLRGGEGKCAELCSPAAAAVAALESTII